MESTQPFSQTLQFLLDDQEVTGREMARRLNRRYKGWCGTATASRFVRGELVPTIEGMERIASVLDHIDPKIFAEYRLGLARRDLDPKPKREGGVGLAMALMNLESWHRGEPRPR